MMRVSEYLKTKKLLFDGSMGTYFANLTNESAEKCEEANLKNPALVEKIHREYIESGARAIKTNTFSPGDNYEEVIRAGALLAKRAAGGEAFVFADLGPLDGDVRRDELYISMAKIFLDEGIENFLFETLSGTEGVFEAARYIKSRAPEGFVIVSFALSPSGYTKTGRHFLSLARETEECEAVDSFGMNCMSGPGHLLRLLKGISTDKFISVMPNAGYPTVLGSRAVYGRCEEYFALRMEEIARSGADIIGGCCGTTPRFISACAKRGTESAEKTLRGGGERLKRRTPRTENPFYEKLLKGEKVIAVELDPPEDMDTEFFMRGASELTRSGCDIITVADCPVARPRMDSSILSCRLKCELGIEPLPHMTCRDRNLNAIKALLLGLNSAGVRNILTVTGDPIPSESRDEVKSVFNFNSRMLIKFISSLNETTFSQPMTVCAALNINAANFDVQLSLAKEKAENGAKVFLTQPLMTQRGLDNLKRARRELDAKLLCGIMPIVSYRNALYMNSEIAGIEVDEKIVEMFRGRTREEAEETGKTVSLAAAEAAKEFCDGYYLITPFKRVGMMCGIIEEIRKRLI